MLVKEWQTSYLKRNEIMIMNIFHRLIAFQKKYGTKKLISTSVNKFSSYLDKIIFRIFSLTLPIKSNYIVMESEGDYTDNIRVFSDYLIANELNDKYKLIWIVHEPSKYPKYKNVIFTSRYKFVNFRADYYCAVSKFFLFSHPYWFKKLRNEQIVINTTHSVAQLKASPANPKQAPFDFLLICSPYCGYIKKKSYKIDPEHQLNIGMPRIDILFKDNQYVKKLIPNYQDQIIILSMETFKQARCWSDSDDVDAYAINVVKSEAMIRQLDQFLHEHNAILINKIHHLQDMSFIKAVNLNNIIYLSDEFLLENDILPNHLLSVADGLLTDYSSVFYEYLLLDRPIGFLIGDMESYSRGFIMEEPLSEMPGFKIRSFNDLLQFVSDVCHDEDNYQEERHKIKQKVFPYCDDKNCERLLEWIDRKREE